MKDSIVIYEAVDTDILNRLLVCDDVNDESISKLKEYKSKIKDGKVRITYKYSNNLNIGRLYAIGPSLQNFKKCIRHTLSDDYYYDIDFVNSGANFLKQYCEKNNIACPCLTKYVKNRETILSEIMEIHEVDRDEAKNFMTRQITLGSYDISKNDVQIDFINKFRLEIKNISKMVCLFSSNEKIVKLVNNDKSKTNKKGSIMSMIIFNIENACLLSMMKFFIENDYNVGTLCFDGIMIRKDDNEVNDSILKDCERYIYEKTTYKVKLLIKPMDSKLDIEHIVNPFVRDDRDAQEKLFNLHGKCNFKYCNGILFIFDRMKGTFEECGKDMVPLTRVLGFYHDVLLLDPLNKGNSNKSYGTDSSLIPKLIPFIKASSEDRTWLRRTDDSSLGLLLFKNGYYDMKNDTFTKEFDQRIVFHESISYNFPKRDERYIKYARNLTFKLYSKNYMPLLVALARSLAGDRGNKSFYFCPGESNTGKSYLVKIFIKCFEDYIGTFNCEDLSYNKGDRDEAANNRWAYLVRYKRILFSNECNMEKSLNSNSIKKFSSGGDKIIGRVHHGNEAEFSPHFHLFCMLNDIPKITPIDGAIKNRLQYFSFNRRFVDNPNEDENKLDPDIDSKIDTKKFRDGFVHLVLDAYQYYLENGQPEFDEELKEGWIDDGDPNSLSGAKRIILENYEITKNSKDKVQISEIRNFKDRSGITQISNPKFNSIFIELGAKQSRSGSKRFWCGIKKIDKIDFIG